VVESVASIPHNARSLQAMVRVGEGGSRPLAGIDHRVTVSAPARGPGFCGQACAAATSSLAEWRWP